MLTSLSKSISWSLKNIGLVQQSENSSTCSHLRSTRLLKDIHFEKLFISAETILRASKWWTLTALESHKSSLQVIAQSSSYHRFFKRYNSVISMQSIWSLRSPHPPLGFSPTFFILPVYWMSNTEGNRLWLPLAAVKSSWIFSTTRVWFSLQSLVCTPLKTRLDPIRDGFRVSFLLHSNGE